VQAHIVRKIADKIVTLKASDYSFGIGSPLGAGHEWDTCAIAKWPESAALISDSAGRGRAITNSYSL